MTFTEQIEAALNKPIDENIVEKTNEVYRAAIRLEESYWDSLYTLLLQIRDLEASLSLSQSTVNLLRVAVEGNQKVEQAQNDKITDYCNRILELEAQVEQERFIPVTERLPYKAGECLVIVRGRLFHAIYSEAHNEFRRQWNDGIYEACLPTHWKPINLPSVLTK